MLPQFPSSPSTHLLEIISPVTSSLNRFAPSAACAWGCDMLANVRNGVRVGKGQKAAVGCLYARAKVDVCGSCRMKSLIGIKRSLFESLQQQTAKGRHCVAMSSRCLMGRKPGAAMALLVHFFPFLPLPREARTTSINQTTRPRSADPVT